MKNLQDKIIYICGPITGVENAKENFKEIHDFLEPICLTVLNPFCFKIYKKNPKWKDYMKICLLNLLNSDLIIVLPGWEKSKGASFEVKTAKILEIPIYFIEP